MRTVRGPVHRTRRRSWLLAAPLAIVVIAPATAVALSLGPQHEVTKAVEFTAVACESSGPCIALGNSQSDSFKGVTEVIKHGTPTKFRSVPAYGFIGSAIACPESHLCLATATSGGSSPKTGSYIVQLTDGKPTGKLFLKGYILGHISCSDASSCWIDGTVADIAHASEQEILIHVLDVHTLKLKGFPLPSFRLNNLPHDRIGSLVCHGTTCLAVGLTFTNPAVPLAQSGFIARIVNGVPKVTTTVPKAFELNRLACKSTACFAIGLKAKTPSTPTGTSLVESISFNTGKPTGEHPSPDDLTALTCGGKVRCVAFGTTASGLKGAAVQLSGGVPGKPSTTKLEPATDAVCGKQGCVAVGGTFDVSTFGGVGDILQFS